MKNSFSKENTLPPYRYFEELKTQEFISAVQIGSNKTIGFISYSTQHKFEFLKNEHQIIYITTVIVDKEFRGNGITGNMYDCLFKHLKTQFNSKIIITRTWSTNRSHIRILFNKGFAQILTKKNHRGNSIDTLYFRKDL